MLIKISRAAYSTSPRLRKGDPLPDNSLLRGAHLLAMFRRIQLLIRRDGVKCFIGNIEIISFDVNA